MSLTSAQSLLPNIIQKVYFGSSQYVLISIPKEYLEHKPH